MSQKPDEQQPQPVANGTLPLRAAEPPRPGAQPPGSSTPPVQTDTDRGEMWIQL